MRTQPVAFPLGSLRWQAVEIVPLWQKRWDAYKLDLRTGLAEDRKVRMCTPFSATQTAANVNKLN